MNNNAELAAAILRSAAAIFRSMPTDDDKATLKHGLNAQICEIVADLVDSDPTGEIPEPPEFEPERNWLQLLNPYSEDDDEKVF